MLCKIIVTLIVASACVFAYEDCGSQTGSIVDLKVSNCDNSKKCPLKRNTNVTIEIDFNSNVESDKLQAVVYGVLLDIPVPFSLPNPDGCKDSGITCPIAAGQKYHYVSTLPVLAKYPRVTVDVKWELQDKDGKNVVCLLIPSQIK